MAALRRLNPGLGIINAPSRCVGFRRKYRTGCSSASVATLFIYRNIILIARTQRRFLYVVDSAANINPKSMICKEGSGLGGCH